MKQENKTNEKFDKSLNNYVFFYEFCLLKFFKGIFYLLKILKNYFINYLSYLQIVEVQSSIEKLKDKLFDVICDLNNTTSERKNIIEMFNHAKLHNYNFIDLFEFISEKKYLEESYLQNDEEEYFNIHVIFTFNLLVFI